MAETSFVDQNLWTIIITWGMVQCFVLAPILFYQESDMKKQRFALVSILLLVGLQTFNFLFEYFRWYQELPHLIWVSAPFWFLIGPAIYFFQKFSIKTHEDFKIVELFHFAPFIIAILYIGDFYTLEAEQKISTLEHFYTNYYASPDYFFYAFIISQLLYAVYVYYKFNEYFKSVGNEYSNSQIYQNRWVLGMLAGFIVYCLLSIGYNALLILDYDTFIPIDYITFLFLTIFVQSFGLSAILYPDQFFVTPISEEMITNKNIKEQCLEKEADLLIEFMEETKPYKNPELRLSDLSTMMDIPAYKLSQIINRTTGKNFFGFVNDYRVEEVKSRLPNPDYTHLTLEAIASECGFNSSASFYRVFKKKTGMTPNEYIKEVT